MSETKWVYRFDEVEAAEAYVKGEWDSVKGLLGGKGANLADMARLGVPVPPGFTVTTEACLAYLDADASREASIRVLRDVRARGEPAHPYYWAGFLTAGDWH